MTDYNRLDAAILAALSPTNPISFSALSAKRAVLTEAKALTPDESFRAVERRLQALRKAGKIKLAPKRAGWLLAEGDPK